MKSPIKILLIFFAITQLAIVLYFSLPSIPRRIRNQEQGNMYTFQHMAFNLTSSEYIEDEKASVLANLELGIEEGDLLTLKDSKEEIVFSIIAGTNNKELFDNLYNNLVNPFNRHFYKEDNLNSKHNLETYQGSIESIPKDIEFRVYKGQGKTFILLKHIFNDDSFSYSTEFKLGGNFYTILIPENTEPEEIYEFMRTVNINQ